MRVLFLTHFFPPEIGAPQSRILDTALYLQRHHHEVAVLTTFPHYPDGKIPHPYRGKVLMREALQGVPVVRSWVLAGPNRGILRRTLDQVSFAVSALPSAAFVSGKPDIISVDIHPVFLCATAYALSRIWRIPYVVVAGDLHPEMARELGVLTNPVALRTVKVLSDIACRNAAAIAPMTAGIERLLLARGIEQEKLELIHYGADLRPFDDRDQWQPMPADLAASLAGKVVFSYVGTHGVSQGLRIVLDAAERLRDQTDVIFLMVGDGAEKRSLREEASRRQLANVIFWDPLPRDVIPSVYERSTACLVSLRRLQTFREAALPSKLFEIMAARRPVIAAAEGESADIVRRAQGGLVIPPEDPAMLADAVMRLKASDAADEMGACGRAYVEANFSREQQTRKYEELLHRLLA